MGLTPKWRRLVDPYKAAAWKLLQRCLRPLRCGRSAGGCGGCWRQRRQGSDAGAATSGDDAAGIEVVPTEGGAKPTGALSFRASAE